MRALIFSLFIVPIATTALAAPPEPQPVFEMSVKGHYGRQITRVFKSGKVWVCKTELTPYHESARAPVDFAKLDEIKKANARSIASECRDAVVILDRRAKKTVSIGGCLDENAKLREFVDRVDIACGR